MPSNGRLNTWKEIAEFLQREVRTVQRWEKTEGLPVHRHRHAKLDSVYAFEEELQKWQQARRRVGSYESSLLTPAVAAPSENELTAPADLTPLKQDEVARVSAGTRQGLRVATFVGLGCLAAFAIIYIQRYFGTGALGSDLTTVPFISLDGNQLSGPSFSPDGKQVVFVWGGATVDSWNLYVRRIGEFTDTRLTKGSTRDFSPVWSPDGKMIAFCRQSSKNQFSVWTFSLKDRQEEKVAELNFTNSAASRSLSWLPDSRSLVVSDPLPESHRNVLFVLDTQTGAKRQITFPALGAMDLYPQVSSIGTVAFVRDQGLGVCSLRLIDEGRSGEFSNERELKLSGFEHEFIGETAWTADRSHLVFVSARGAMRRLWLVDADGRLPPKLLPFGYGTGEPVISRDGKLVFASSTLRINVWRSGLKPEDRSTTRVFASSRSQDNPKISPDGKRLAYVMNGDGSVNVWTSRLDGSGAIRLTSMPGGGTGSPAWSPDGSQVVFDARAEGKPAIYLIPSQGGKARRITDLTHVSVTPAWSSDGRSIYFSSDRSGQMEIWGISPAGTDPVQITEGGGFAPQPAPDGVHLYYSKTGGSFSPLYCLNLTTSREELIAPSVFDRAYAPAADGVYYIPETHHTPFELFFRSATSQAKRPVLNFDKPPRYAMSVTPDGSALYLSKVDVDEHEILLVNKFWR